MENTATLLNIFEFIEIVSNTFKVLTALKNSPEASAEKSPCKTGKFAIRPPPTKLPPLDCVLCHRLTLHGLTLLFPL